MSRWKKKGGSNQRADLGKEKGFIALPYVVIDSEAYGNLSVRARAVLNVLIRRWNGFNNGKIALSIRDLNAKMGRDNPAANSAALRELEAFGFVRLARNYSPSSRMAREFRLTFVETGPAGQRLPATNEYRDYSKTETYVGWQTKRNGKGNKPTPPKKRTESRNAVSNIKTTRKFLGSNFDAEKAETPRNAAFHGVSNIEAHIRNHACGRVGGIYMELSDLRDYARHYFKDAPRGSKTRVADEAGINGGTLTKFLLGSSLPVDQRGRLQEAIARRGQGAGIWLENRHITPVAVTPLHPIKVG